MQRSAASLLPSEAVVMGHSWAGNASASTVGEADPGPSPEEIQLYLDSARKPILLDRARVMVGAVITITIAFLGVTFAAGNPSGWTPQAIRFLNLGLLVGVWRYLRIDRRIVEIERATLLAMAFSCVCSAVVSTIQAEPVNTALGMLAVTLSSAAFLPWRMRMQVALVVICSLALSASLLHLQAQLRFTTAITAVTAAGAFIATVYMVWTLHEVRRRGILDDLMRRRAEQHLQVANDALEERVQLRTAEVRAAIRELETFNYAVSHDLRSPLRIIHGMVQLIEEEFPGPLDELTASRLDRVKAATRRLGELMDAILARSRVSQAEMRPILLDLAGMGDDAMRQLRADNPERAVEWVRPPELDVMGDPMLIRLVLENLLDNAWKFTRGREPGRIELGTQTNDGGREIFVRDNGVGFDKTHAAKLFESFQRFHGDEYEGHGIGLAMARRIIERHGGSIRAETELGVGTTIYFALGDLRGLRA
ncbi:MAG TPA: ATP-binding protein [Candidatus Binatia bacterium]|nr:ATP-binding protein [Candidatus Binatia bacterium]